MTDRQPVAEEIWNGRYDSTTVRVLEVGPRHILAEDTRRPGSSKRYTRAQFHRAFAPPKEPK